MRIGRNDPCPCGGGEKYKKCHEIRAFNKYDENYHEIRKKMNSSNLHERNLILIDAINDIFGFLRGTSIEEFKRKISGGQIKELYEIIGNLWHFTTDIYELLPNPGIELQALYLGDVFPEMIIKNVIRFSLYTDKIYIINPFLNPWTLKKEFNPLYKPNEFKIDTLKLINFILLLEPWIKNGIIELLPYPGDFNYQLNMECYELAEKRLEGWKPSKKDLEEHDEFYKEQFERYLLSLPDEVIIQQIKDANIDFKDEQIPDVLEHIKQKKINDPLALDQQFTRDNIEPQFSLYRSGANLEMALYISQLTGAFPYTNISHRWKELLSANNELIDTAKLWTPLTKAFQSLDFNFLNNVDIGFIQKSKENGRLLSFRNFMKKIWNTIGGEPDINKIDNLTRDFCDELNDEYNKQREEWKNINKEIVSWIGYTTSSVLLSSAFGKLSSFQETGSIISGNMALCLSLGLATVTKLLGKYAKKRSFRKTVPLSIFIDLSKHKGKYK